MIFEIGIFAMLVMLSACFLAGVVTCALLLFALGYAQEQRQKKQAEMKKKLDETLEQARKL